MHDFLTNESGSYESLLSMLVDKTFKNHGIKTGNVRLSNDEYNRLVETIKILQSQSEKFIANPTKRVKPGVSGASKFVPTNAKKKNENN